MTSITDTSSEDKYTHFIIYLSVLLRKKFSDKFIGKSKIRTFSSITLALFMK